MIEWDEDQVRFLRDKWSSDLSAAAIARTCSAHFRQPVSKNAVIGKAHRMEFSEPGLWPARPSPIRRAGDDLPHAPPPRRCDKRPDLTLPPLPSLRPTVSRGPQVGPQQPARHVPLQPDRIVCEARDPARPLRRGDGSGCLWPIGVPGRPDFRYCDGDLCAISKPYCPKHATLGVVGIPGRRAS